MSTSFALNCSASSLEYSTPWCQRLRDLFAAKQVLGRQIFDIECAAKQPYPDPRGYRLDKRLEWIHDGSNDLWYKCCEYRPKRGNFTVDVPHPRFAGGDAHSLKSTGMAAPNLGYQDKPKDPIGPLLQCNVYREKVDLGLAKGKKNDTLQQVTLEKWRGDGHGLGKLAGAALQEAAQEKLNEFMPSIQVSALSEENIDPGLPGEASPLNAEYHVFELAVPDPMLSIAISGNPVNCCPRSSRRRREAAGTNADGGDNDLVTHSWRLYCEFV